MKGNGDRAADSVEPPGDGQVADGDTRASARSTFAGAARRFNRDPRLLSAARRARGLLPGDPKFGDPLSAAGSRGLSLANRAIQELTDERPGLVAEAGLGALQVWQATLDRVGRGRGDRQVTVLFTDLVGFSSWALRAGDEQALSLLRAVAGALEPPVRQNGGEVIKRLGDGMMAAFGHPQRAIDAVIDGRQRLDDVHTDGYRPRIRAGLHTGRPHRVGDDYLGVDVNIAARVAEKADADELLVSGQTLEMIDRTPFGVRRRRSMFRVKGTPDELEIYALTPRE
jgi:adenylate cyclase